MSYFSPLINKSPSYWHLVIYWMYGIVKKVWSTKNRFGPAEVFKVPVQMTTRSQVLLLNSATDLNINRDHLIIKDYLPTKIEASGAKSSWVTSISCTRFKQTYQPTDRRV